jgi:crotonobetainyl-CoA:carnitine CoA-transferase CaiB-like acyl-CoA transferase
MDPNRMPEAFLGPYRVLDLTTEQGLIAGKLLGDLGADVIKVEPPGGEASRNNGPFYHDDPGPERSLYWMAFNLNKRGITLNLDSADGRALFLRLVKTADFVVESFAPGYMESIGLGYNALSRENPRVIVTAISPFGQSGPYSQFKSTDLVNMALGAYAFTTGDADRPPVRISFPLSYCHAGAEAAAASAMAHYHRERTGEGQFIDVSIQECVIWTLMNTTTTWDLAKVNVTRGGSVMRNPQTGVMFRTVWPCKDGNVTMMIAGGAIFGAGVRALVAWMTREAAATQWLQDVNWDEMDMAEISQESYDAIAAEVAPFLLSRTVGELYDRAVSDRILLAPVSTAELALQSPQLEAREAFVKIDHPELGGTLTYPGAFVKMSAWSPRIFRRAPHVGEHNQEVYCDELGLSRLDLAALKQAGVV